MSIPAETPEEVTMFPSSTQRARLTHLTFGQGVVARDQKALFVVAGRPSKRPAAARTDAPLQTDIVISAFADRSRSQSSVLVSVRMLSAPKPPGTRIRSSGGQSLNPNSATVFGPWD